jgi:cytochrome P450 family 110
MLETLPAGPTGKLRTTYRIVRDPLGSFPAWQQRFGDPFTVSTVNGTVVVTGDPKLVKEIFAAPPSIFAPWATQNVGSLLGEASLLALHEPRHMLERKLLMPPFHGERMRTYADAMCEVTKRQLAETAHCPRFSALALVQSISLQIIVRSIFGAQDDARTKVLSEAALGLGGGTSPLLFFMPFLRRELGGFGPWARFRRRFEALDRLLQEQIDHARAQGDGTDICSLLVEARYDDGTPMRDDDIRDELRTLLFAGHDTTALTLAWVFDHVHRHPKVLARLRDEIDELGPEPDPAAYARLPYLEAVYKEAMRLYPLANEVQRRLVAPFQLGALDLTAGVGVAASALLVHRREELYPDPLKYRPERFLERKFAPYEYLPFGGGHRRCIGAAFASFEMAVVVGTALSRFDFELLDEQPPRPIRHSVTMGPSGDVPMRARARR